MDWDRLRVFHAVANAGSFTKATDVLNISQSAISRQISLLEKELETILFKRTSRGLVLTQSGDFLNATVSHVYAKVAETKDIFTQLKTQPSGLVRIATSHAFGSFWLAPRLLEFLSQYPEIQLELLLKDTEIDINMREADIGILDTPLTHPEMINLPSVAYPLRIYASQPYIHRFGMPSSAEALDNHQIIVFGKEMPHFYSHVDWLLKIGASRPRIPFLVINSAQGILEAVRSGLGIACLHKYMVNDAPELVEVLPELEKVVMRRQITYPQHLRNIRRYQIMIEFLQQKMQEDES